MRLVKFLDSTRNIPVYVNPEHVQSVHQSGNSAMLILDQTTLLVNESVVTVVFRLLGRDDAV